MNNLKLFVIECLLFTKANEGYPIKNWMLAIFAWLQIFVIVTGVLSIIS